jgi:molybdopterin converting factor small subunit
MLVSTGDLGDARRVSPTRLEPRTMTPAVTVHLSGPLRAYCGGKSELALEAETVRVALDRLERDEPALYRNLCDETGLVRRHLNVFVNSDHVRDLEGLETKLKAGDVLTFLPAVSGG